MPVYLMLVAVQGGLCAGWLFSLPSDGGGLSSQRVLLAVPMLLGGLAALVLGWLETRSPGWFVRRFPVDRLRGVFILASFIGLLASLVAFSTLDALARGSPVFFYRALLQRFTPLLIFTGLTSFEALLLLLARAWQPALRPALGELRLPLLATWLAGGLFYLAARLWTAVNPVPASGSWGGPGVPLLEWQIGLAWAAGGGMLFFEARMTRSRRLDNLSAVLLWVLCACLWAFLPLTPGYFATPPRAPNHEIYPFSDGLIYAETAQSILVGSGLSNQVVPARPLYALFLAGLHALVGQDYAGVAGLQAMLLAFYPALVYLLCARLNLRPAGLAAALLLVFRDVNANLAAPFTFNLTYSRLYFSEIPVALLITLFSLLVVLWLESPQRPGLKPLLAGGVLGLGMLVRTQVVVLLAPLALCGLVVYLSKKDQSAFSCLKVFAFHFGLCAAGLLLAVAPWLARNASLTGGLMFDHPVSQTMVVAQRYNDLHTSQLIPMLPGETLSQFSNRLGNMALQGLVRQPGVILSRAAGHFLNSQMSSLEIFPVRPDLSEPRELLLPLRAFWQVAVPHPLDGNPPAMLGLLALLGIGIAAAWRSKAILGLLPLGIQGFYNLWTSLFLSSGDRFLAPVDWCVLVYASAGLVFLAQCLFLAARDAPQNALPQPEPLVLNQSPAPQRFAWRARIILGVLILAAGASLPLSEVLIPARYPAASQAELRLRLSQAFSAARLDLPGILTSSNSEMGIMVQGRALYPRFYAAGEGEPETAKRGYAPEPRARLVFSLVGPQAGTVVFYPSETVNFFPHAADVLMVGSSAVGWSEPDVIVVSKDGQSALYRR